MPLAHGHLRTEPGAGRGYGRMTLQGVRQLLGLRGEADAAETGTDDDDGRHRSRNQESTAQDET